MRHKAMQKHRITSWTGWHQQLHRWQCVIVNCSVDGAVSASMGFLNLAERLNNGHHDRHKNPNLNLRGWESITHTGSFSLGRLLQSKTKPVSWLAVHAYSLYLPKVITSVACTDFVPLTVAGQRWICTIFPYCSVTLQYNLAYDPIHLQVDRIVAVFALSSLQCRVYPIGEFAVSLSLLCETHCHEAKAGTTMSHLTATAMDS